MPLHSRLATALLATFVLGGRCSHRRAGAGHAENTGQRTGCH